jgi:hypothetical protein
MDNEISESAKAVQEVAKTAKAGIEATEKLGGFVSRIIDEPLRNVIGILSDRLRFMRAERQLRLVDRWMEIIDKRNISGELRTISPKLALPIIEAASIEEDDELQDLWINLLTSAVDPNFDGVVRSAFIDIIKQLEAIDVHILTAIYEETVTKNLKYITENSVEARSHFPVKYGIASWEVTNKLQLSREIYEESIDNLMRVRCVAPYVEEFSIDTEVDGQKYGETVSLVHEFQYVRITSLGLNFIRACTDSGTEQSREAKA